MSSSLPLETAESPFKNKNSLGQVLVDGNQLDISNINCYLQLLAQTANKKEKLRRKKRRERREKKKGNSSSSSSKEQRRKARKSERGEGKGKEIEPDLPADHHHQQQHIKSEHLMTPSTDENGLTLAPTLPSQSGHPNGAMGRRAVSSPMAELAFDHHATSSFAPPSRSSSWSQFVIDHTQQQHQQQEAMGVYMNASPPHVVSNPTYPQPQFLHRSSPAALYGNVVGHQPYMQLHPHQQQPHFDPAAEFIQFMTEHQSCSNPSFTFSSSFSSDALSPITEENFMGFPTGMPCGAANQSPFLGQHATADPTVRAHAQMHHHHPQQPPPSNYYPADFGGLLASSTPTSSFGMEPIDDRDGTFASLEFLEAALAQDMRDA